MYCTPVPAVLPVEHICKIPLPPPNGQLIVHGSVHRYEPGVMIEFTCNNGYEMVGSNFSECLADGSWSFEPPQCFSKLVRFLKTDAVICRQEGTGCRKYEVSSQHSLPRTLASLPKSL